MNIQSVPLSALQPPADNPRTTFDAALLEGLAASIKADGLLQNLVVTPTKGKGRYRIISGERRYRALKLLAERGDIGDDESIAVEVRTGLSKDDTLRLATIENLQREDLPPLDQASALTTLIRKGTTLDDLVSRTGLSASTIKRRLALNGLCDEAAQALRNRVVTLAQAEALTLGTPEAQCDIVHEIEHGRSSFTPDEIREHFLDGRPSVASAIFPRENYTGTLTTDLFQSDETSYFDDTEQFMQLQTEAVARLAEEYRAKADWVEITNSHRIPAWQYDEAADGEPAGVIINLSPNGTVEVREGLARPDRIDADTASETGDAPAAALKRKAAYPTPLRRYIAWHKTTAVQEVLLADQRKAREVLAVHLLRTFKPHAALRELPGEEAAQVPFLSLDAGATQAARTLGLTAEAYARGWDVLVSGFDDDVSVYRAVRALSDADLERLTLLLTALSFGQQNCERLDSGDTLFNAVATDLAVDMRHHWRIDTAFLSRRTRVQLTAIAKACGFSDGHSAVHAWKKAELVTALLRHFEQARSATDPTPAQTKALAWLPEAMLFPAVDPDAPGDACDTAQETSDDADCAEAEDEHAA